MTVGRILYKGDGRTVDKGTGFVLATKLGEPSRLVLTANHVVRGKDATFIYFALEGDRTYSVERVERDEDIDVAVLHLREPAGEGFACGQAREHLRWQVDARPRGNDPKLTGSITAVDRSFTNSLGRQTTVMQLAVEQDLAEFAGYSGSPVLQQLSTATNGVTVRSGAVAVIGVLVEQLPLRTPAAPGQRTPAASNVLYAVKIQHVLERFGLTAALAPPGASGVADDFVFWGESEPEYGNEQAVALSTVELRSGVDALRARLNEWCPELLPNFKPLLLRLEEILGREHSGGRRSDLLSKRVEVLTHLEPMTTKALGVGFFELCRYGWSELAIDAPFRSRPLQAQQTGPTLPMELGTVWGLERLPFAGVVFTPSAGSVFDALVSAEHRLRSTLADAPELKLPMRRWILAEYVTGLKAPATIRPETECLGILARLKLNDLDRCAVEDYARLSEAFEGAAFVLCVEGEQISLSRSQRDLLLQLRERLQRLLRIPVQLIEPFEPTKPYSVDSTPKPDQFGLMALLNGPVAPQPPRPRGVGPGVALLTWVHEGLKLGRVGPSTQADRLAPYATLIDLFRQHPVLATVPLPELPVAADAVADLDLLADASSGLTLNGEIRGALREALLDEQLIQLVADHLPERLANLIAAYAASRRPAARIAALFAARNIPRLLDTWLDATLAANTFPVQRELYADPRRGPFVHDLLVALLRRLHRTGDTSSFEERLKDLGPQFSQRTGELISLRQKLYNRESLEAGAEEGAGVTLLPELVYDLLRIDPDLAVKAHDPARLRLDSPVPWWLMAAQQLKPPTLAGLLQRGIAERAVFGLCRADELIELKGDWLAWQRVEECRIYRSYTRPDADEVWPVL